MCLCNCDICTTHYKEDEPQVVYKCEECGCEIFEGNYYFDIANTKYSPKYCDVCGIEMVEGLAEDDLDVLMFRHIAEKDEEDIDWKFKDCY